MSLQRVSADSNGDCFLLEITQYANQMTCFVGHVMCLWIGFVGHVMCLWIGFSLFLSTDVKRSLGAYFARTFRLARIFLSDCKAHG